MTDPTSTAQTAATIWPMVSNGLIALGGLAGAFALAKSTLFTVPQQHQGLVSRFGKYTGQSRDPGLQVKIPFIDKVDANVSTALQEVETTLDTKTKDNQFIQLPIAIQFSIVDPAKYHYDTTAPKTQISNIISAAVRSHTSGMDFQEIYDSKDDISESVIGDVKERVSEYGINLHRIVVDEPQPDRSVKDAYNAVRASERAKEAAQNEAEAERIRIVERAKADAERTRLTGESVKDFRKSIAESYIETRQALINAEVDEATADRFMEEAMRLDTLRDVGEKGNLIITPMKEAGMDESTLPQVMAGLRAAGVLPAAEQDNSRDTAAGAAASSQPAPGA